MFRMLFLLNFIDSTLNYYIIKLNEEYQYETYQLDIESMKFSQDTYFAYGVWTRYAPLSGIAMVGNIGIFDTNCYNIHNAIDILDSKINFLYYDCIDEQQNIIIKTIRFIDEKGDIHMFEIFIEKNQYEFQWYYFQIMQWPNQQRLQIIILFAQSIIMEKVIEIQYPFNSKNIMIKFGGDLIIDSTQELSTGNQNIFSSFPGKMYLFPLSFGENSIENQISEQIQYLVSIFSPFQPCQCYQNYDIPMSMDFSSQTLYAYNSNHRYCDQYTLNGWIKLIDITKINAKFSYLFIKMCANSENAKITNQNLCAFQLFFDISNDIQKIRITTYNYELPQINLDFTQNQNLITHEFQFNNIFSWIQLQVVLIQNDYTVFLRYYDDNSIFQQQFTQQVNHFHLVQFKILFGNVLQSQQDFIKAKIYNFIFNNCFGYFIDNFCDSRCLTCDGPNSNDCLSCDINQNRIYIEEQKTCICPYGYIDDFTCQNYQSYNFEIDTTISDQSQQCGFGYFEFDQHCIQCPSIIKRNLLTCLECIYNPINWILEPVCKSYLVLDEMGSPFQTINEQQSFNSFLTELI